MTSIPDTFQRLSRSGLKTTPTEFQALLEPVVRAGNRDEILAILDWGHLSESNRFLARNGLTEPWMTFLEQALTRFRYSFDDLFRQRVSRYGEKPFLQTLAGSRVTSYSFADVFRRVRLVSRCLVKLETGDRPTVVGLLTPNCPEGVWVDLACLRSGIQVVPIPINVSPSQLEFILHHACITDVFVGGQATLSLLKEIRLSSPPRWIRLPSLRQLPFPSRSWEEFLGDPGREEFSAHPVDPEFATILYTSGTTAHPKGIVFSLTALLIKRFARALALPRISSEDHFLAYLPLYHTFGRYFELMGALFWGATYTFAESTSFKTLLQEFPLVRPTIFISIPKRWVQLYEQVRNNCSFEKDSADTIRRCIRQLTGGKLTWGLSAAGYLDPDIFEFFQRHGLQLLSGYGMTEATGGIFMTPPEDYLRNSVGKPLPGLEAELAADGELKIRGPYVCRYYHGSPPEEMRRKGWFYTGDIFQRKQGHYFIVDRKKEIYKNSRGQTIAPQKIENLFQDFEPIRRVFLVGDGREFNTLLIYPNPEYQFPADITPGTPEYNDFFSSLIQSVNSFLAPYERIVNFAFLDRDFTEEQGELTRKGTFRRKVILDHFGPLIEPMYARDHLSFISGNLELKLPHWLTREWGVSRADISWNGETLAVDDRRLTIRQVSDTDLIQIGDFFYSLSTETIDLNAFFHSPRDWLGNSAWVQFIGRSLFPRIQSEAQENLILQEDRLPFCTVESLPTAQEQEHPLLYSHRLALSCFCRDHASTIQAVRSLAGDLNTSPRSGQAPLMTALLLRCRYHPRPVVRMEMIARVLPFIDGVTFLSAILDARLEASPEVATRIHEWKLTEEQFQTLLDHLAHLRREGSRETSPEHICLCLRLIGQYGRLHPSSYRWARAELVWWEMVSETEAVRTLARRQREELVTGFRSWLGLPQQLAIDPDSGEEFTWADVTLFDDQISDSSREWLLQFLQSTAGVTEAIYLFTGKILLRLEDIAPKGVWISHLGHSHGKHVYRVLIQARSGDAYNMVINHNESIPEAEFAAETGWLILLGSSHHGERLVEIFGGYWPEFGIYTEEFIPGETVLQHLEINRNKIRSGKNPDRWRMRWLHFIWNGAMAYIDFWLRTGCTYAFDRPSPANLIIPIYDYTTGTRLISISSRSRIRNPLHILVAFYRHFILETERDFPGLQRMADWEILLTAFIQKTSVKKGVEYFQDMIHNWSENPAHSEARSLGLTPDRLRRFIEDVNREGVLTKPVVFASLRYERWLQLNPHATREARASLLKELYNDYHLAALLDDYPETRIRFFLMTCFRHSHPAVKQELYALQKALRARAISLEELDIHLSRLQDLPTLSSEDSYFLSRLLFAHLGSAEQGELITWDWGAQNRLDLITAIEDEQGNVYRIRPPFLPKEIAHFHALLQEANFNPTFRQEHQFLLLFNPNRVVIGGVYWKPNGIDTAYIERVVISHHYRKQHLSTRLLEELFNRLRDKSYRYVTVGFFQAGLFYKLGFMVNKDFGGLVKPLE